MKVYKIKGLCHLEKGKQIDTTLLNDSNPYKYINGGVKESGYYTFYNTEGEAVLISEGGASCGYVNYIDEKFWCGCHCYKLTDCKCLPKYLYYALKRNQNRLMELRTGAAMPNIKKATLQNMDLRLSGDIATQKKVVSNLDKLQSVISNRKQQLTRFDDLIKSRFVELFIGKGYPTKTVDEVSLGKGEYGAQSASVEYNPTRPRYVRITDINDDGTLNDDVVASIDPTDDEQYKLEYGDFMFARMGATVGKTYAFIKGNQIFAGYLIRYKLNQNLINPQYLFWYTKLDEYWNWVKLNQSGAAQPGINAKKYGSMQIPLPPIEKQNKFADFVSQVDKSKFAIQKAIDKAQLLFDSLLQEYFE